MRKVAALYTGESTARGISWLVAFMSTTGECAAVHNVVNKDIISDDTGYAAVTQADQHVSLGERR